MTKKSDFPALSDIPSDATLDFVSGGANYKIALADYLAAIGATGSISQVGNATGAPVLDVQGSVNGIRTISDGSGIKASINAWNGLTLEHNFTADATGVPVLTDTTSLSPTLRSIVAGSGIAVSQVDDTIVIADSGVVASTKTVVVNQKTDFPTAISGVITLESDTNYLLANDIAMGTDRLVLQDYTSIQGSGILTITLSYTGTGDLFTWVNSNINIGNLRISATNGRVWNGSNVSEVIRMQNLSIDSCDKVGRFASTTSTNIRLTFVACSNAISDGIEFSGTFNAFGHTSGLMAVNGGAMYDLGTSTFFFFTSDTVVAVVGAGAIGMSGATGSANIAAGGAGRVLAGSISGAGTAVSGISIDDTGWLFFHNNNFPDTKTDALLSLQGNATATVITAASTDGSNAVLIAGTWVVELSSRVTATTAGRITFDPDASEQLPVTASVSVEPVSGSNVSISVYMSINGTIVANSKRSGAASAGSPSSITMPWQHLFDKDDYIEIFVENNDNTTNILVSSAVQRLN